MSLTGLGARVPISVQVGVVAALFVAALIVLWVTGASVVARERRRSEAKILLDEADDKLAERGRDAIAHAKYFPAYPENSDRTELDRTLGTQATEALRTTTVYKGVISSAATIVSWARTSRHPKPPGDAVVNVRAGDARAPARRGQESLPPLENELIEIQVDAAIRKRQVLFSVEELEGDSPVTVAIRTAPIEVDDDAGSSGRPG